MSMEISNNYSNYEKSGTSTAKEGNVTTSTVELKTSTGGTKAAQGRAADYDEKAFEMVGPNAPQEVKDAWMEAAKEVNANGMGIRGNGMMSHISQMMVQRKDISMKERIKNRVHELYWNDDINCARTAIICLGELFQTAIEPQTIWSAVGLHGAGGYRAQCGIVEGTLMFIGIYLHKLGKTENEIISACYNFASAFEKAFGSLRCLELRPTGFSENDPPHMCENLTCKGIEFAYQYILQVTKPYPQ